MQAVTRYQIIAGLLVVCFCAAGGVADAKSWRELKPLPASRITWEKGIIGIEALPMNSTTFSWASRATSR